MRRVLLVVALAACSRHNPDSTLISCTPGEQRSCACIGGGATGVQICNLMGTGLGECLGCPGGPQLDMVSLPQDLSLADFSLADFSLGFDFPPGTDLTGFNPSADLAGGDLAGADLSVPEEDMAMSLPDMAQPIDLAGADLTPITPCPVVLLVLDTSGSMVTNFTGLSTTHIDGAHQALDSLVDSYGGRVPFGFAHFDDQTLVCTDGVVTDVEPMAGSAAAVKSAVNSTMPGGATNTGDAINAFAADPNMHDPARQGSFIVLVTDGAGNCETTDPSFTVTAVGDAANAAKPIKTYVIALDVAAMGPGDEAEMELMAQAGKEPCTTGFCNGHDYFPAPDPAHLARALDLVLNDIVASSPGGSCGNFACFPSGAPCGAGTSCCGTQGCKNLQTDNENCGQCGSVCGTGATCSGGACHCGSVECAAGDSCCGNTCCSKLDMSQPPDMRLLPDMRSSTDMKSNGLPACVCTTPCITGCIAANCCAENGCSATPTICNCSPGVLGGC
jgi:hypothetical protein